MRKPLDMDKLARGLGAERQGKIDSSGGYFGAMQLVADIQSRLRVPAGGGRPTNPQWTERRLLPLAPRTLKRLEQLTANVKKRQGLTVEPMQLAALLLERTTEQLSDDSAHATSEAHPLILAVRDSVAPPSRPLPRTLKRRARSR